MNPEQAKSAVRWLIATFGGVIAGWFAAKGWFTVEQVTGFLNNPETVSLIASVVISLIPSIIAGIWGLFAHTEKNATVVVDKIAQQKDSPVKAVIAEDTPAGRDLANSLPGSTTVVAGSPAAARAAQ